MNREIESRQKKAFWENLEASQRVSVEAANFPDFMDKKLREYRDEYDDSCTRETLAKRFGVGYETMKKAFNDSRATRNRDLLIAICMALRMNRADTNYALRLRKLPELNEDDKRDYLLLQSIDAGDSPEAASDTLQSSNLAPLLLSEVKRTVLTAQENVLTPIFEEYYPIWNDSEYDPQFHSGAYEPANMEMGMTRLLRDRDGSLVELRTREINAIRERDEGEIRCYRFDDVCVMRRYANKDAYRSNQHSQIEQHKNAIQFTDPEIRKNLQDMEYKACKETRRHLAILNDTRNYSTRFCFAVRDDVLCVYGEAFDNINPTYSLYTQIQVLGNDVSYSVTNTSLFMQMHLGKEMYETCYGKIKKAEEYLKVHSVAEAKALAEKETSPYKKENAEYFAGLVERIAKECATFIERIKQGEICLDPGNHGDSEEAALAQRLGIIDMDEIEKYLKTPGRVKALLAIDPQF